MIFHKTKAPGTPGMYMEDLHQDRKLQWSSITKRLEQEKEEKAKHQAKKEWRRRDLISRVDRSVPSKHKPLKRFNLTSTQ